VGVKRLRELLGQHAEIVAVDAAAASEASRPLDSTIFGIEGEMDPVSLESKMSSRADRTSPGTP